MQQKQRKQKEKKISQHCIYNLFAYKILNIYLFANKGSTFLQIYLTLTYIVAQTHRHDIHATIEFNLKFSTKKPKEKSNILKILSFF